MVYFDLKLGLNSIETIEWCYYNFTKNGIKIQNTKSQLGNRIAGRFHLLINKSINIPVAIVKIMAVSIPSI